MMRALRHEASDMAQQLSLAQESIAFKEKIIEQLKALCNSVDLAGLGLAPDGGSVQGVSGSSTPSHGAWHSSSSSPGHVAGGSDRRELSRQSSKGLASQHAVGKVGLRRLYTCMTIVCQKSRRLPTSYACSLIERAGRQNMNHSSDPNVALAPLFLFSDVCLLGRLPLLGRSPAR